MFLIVSIFLCLFANLPAMEIHMDQQVTRKVFDQLESFYETLSLAQQQEKLSTPDINAIRQAFYFASEKHKNQTRKDAAATPYIIHPVGVATHLMHVGHCYDRDIIIAALLHDTVEDTETTFEEVDQNFGTVVGGYVRELTDDKSLPKMRRKELQIEHAPHKSAGAAQVKLCDKFYNLTDLTHNPPPDWPVERVDAYFVWAKAVVDALPQVNEPLKQAVDQVIAGYWKAKESTSS